MFSRTNPVPCAPKSVPGVPATLLRSRKPADARAGRVPPDHCGGQARLAVMDATDGKGQPGVPRAESPRPEPPLPEAPRPEAPLPEAPLPEAPLPEAPHPGHADLRHAEIMRGIEALRERLAGLERSVPAQLRSLPREVGEAVPAWRRVTQGEPRWQVSLAVAAAIALQLPVPGRLVLLHPSWVLPVLDALLAVGLIIANPRRINRESAILRYTSMTLIALISLANLWSAERLISDLVTGNPSGIVSNPATLLGTGASIWLTNMIAFALWYWELDRGGPVARALAIKQYPDFQFVQMVTPELAPPGWEPMFADYFYLSFTNASAFSPTDVMPLSRWAKMLMLVQSAAALVTVALVIARAVNILK